MSPQQTKEKDNYADVTLSDLARMMNGYADDIEQRFIGVDKRFDTIETRLDDHDQRFDALKARLDKKIDDLADEMNTRFDTVVVHMKNVESEFASNKGAHERFEEKFEQHDKDIRKIKKRLTLPA